ncbi:YdcF family protein [Nocardioides daejeonensis]|uniref:YdcF family protein n=1 Tax=Nocardioides daejeonensis TaxID=1046556 RepID=UPI001951375B|nr:YdcF family protein [Nocardioides daejeonensis]
MPTTWILAAGVLCLLGGVIGFLRERRRLGNVVALVLGIDGVLLAWLLHDAEHGRGVALVLVVIVLALATGIGYPLLTLFLLWNGITMLRRERRSLGNLLSLLTGLGLLALPVLLSLNDRIAASPSTRGLLAVGAFMLVVGYVGYLGFCFFVFLVAAVLYRRVPQSFRPRYVVVLGSGLIGARVPPLLAARLDRAIAVSSRLEPAPAIIPSGGQGPDEDVSEAVAMADYLRDHGIPEERILVEDRARTTEQNLLFSRALMDDPDAPTMVVTNSYHVFRAALLTRELGMNARVSGARTAAYYVPSAFLREFMAVMRIHLWLNVGLLSAWTLMVVGLLIVSVRS